MPTVLLVADRASVIDRIQAALGSADVSIVTHEEPNTAADAAYELAVDRVIVDQQVGAMGAMAVARAVRAAAGDLDAIPVTVILDREADAFLARRSGAQNWVAKDAPTTDLRAAVIAAELRE